MRGVPADAALAPPGYYMLFIIDAAGTPVGRALDPARRAACTARRRLRPPRPRRRLRPRAPRPAGRPRDVTAPRLRISWLRAPRTRNAVRLRLRTDERARITAVLRVRGHRLRRVVAVRGGRPRTVAIRLPKAVARRLRSGRRVSVTLRLLAEDAAGNRTTVRRSRRLS